MVVPVEGYNWKIKEAPNREWNGKQKLCRWEKITQRDAFARTHLSLRELNDIAAHSNFHSVCGRSSFNPNINLQWQQIPGGIGTNLQKKNHFVEKGPPCLGCKAPASAQHPTCLAVSLGVSLQSAWQLQAVCPPFPSISVGAQGALCSPVLPECLQTVRPLFRLTPACLP